MSIDIPPLVTVLVVYRNVAPFVAGAVRSLKRQTERHFEAVLVNDCSDDDSFERADRRVGRDHRFLHFSTNARLGKARCIKLVEKYLQGQFIAFLDGDDELHPLALASAAAALREAPDAAVCVTGCERMDENGNNRRAWPWNADAFSFQALKHGRVSPALMMVRTDAYFAVGGVEADFEFGQMYDLRLRLAQRFGAFALVPGAMYAYRKWPGQATSAHRESVGRFAALARQRARAFSAEKAREGAA